ncbi:phage tail protein [Streptomyces sp. NPDC056670]|uniref:phage tail protein n=1 Tax=unclassified Streptomyces TaxID=2593676 RepID=UPI00365DEDCB
MTAENVLAGQDITLVIGSTELDSVQTIAEVGLGDDVAKIGGSTTVEDAFGGVTSDVVQSGQVTLVVAAGQGQELVRQLGEAPAVDGQTGEAVSLAIKDAGGLVRRIHLTNAWASRWEGPQLGAANSGVATEQVTITYEDIEVE